MPNLLALLRIAWIAIIAIAAVPEAVTAREQTCTGCLDGCCQTHECKFESESVAHILWDCKEDFCPTYIGAPSKKGKLPSWVPFTKVLGGPLLVRKDHDVYGRPPLALKMGQVFVDGVEVEDGIEARREARRDKA